MKTLVRFCSLYLLLIASTSSEENLLNLSVLIETRGGRDSYLQILSDFRTKYPPAQTQLIFEGDSGYKANISAWLASKAVDVGYIQAGKPLCILAAEKKIAALDEFWQQADLDKKFNDHLKQAVTCDQQIFAIPYQNYYWGFFYKKSLFQKLKLKPPSNWQEMLTLFTKLKDADITPITIGTQNNWPAAVWFDYLNLRLNGLDFHLQLLNAQQSFLDERVIQIFKYWKVLISNDFFIRFAEKTRWIDALPFLYRDMAGVMLTGSFVLKTIPQPIKKDIGFFRFPKLSDNQLMYENLPVDAYMLNTHSKDKKVALDFLHFTIKANALATNSKLLVNAPLQAEPSVANIYFNDSAERMMSETQGFAQYFDRDAHPIIAKEGPGFLAEFVQTGDITKVINALEKLRLSIPSS